MDDDSCSPVELTQLPMYGPPLPPGTEVLVRGGTWAVIESIREHPGPLGPLYLLVSDVWPPHLPFSTGNGVTTNSSLL